MRDDLDRVAYLRRFRRVARGHGWQVHADCLLDTHHHAVLTTWEPNLGHGMRLVLGGHAAWFNARYGGSGSLFADRYWSRRAEAHLVRACIYALVNPVVAGLVDHPSQWRWSSWNEIAERGCSDAIAAATDGTAGFLELVELAVARIHERRPRTTHEAWTAIALPPQAEGRG